MDIFLWLVVAVTQIGIGLLGIVAIRSEFAQRHFWLIFGAFVGLSAIGLLFAGITAFRANKYSDMVAQLTQQILYEVRGAPDGLAIIHPYFLGEKNIENGKPEFNIYNESKYPVVDANISIVGTQNLNLPEYNRKLGDLPGDYSGKLIGLNVQFGKEDDNRIDFCISSRSVILWQSVYASWNGKHFVTDWSIRRQVGKRGKTECIKKLRTDFPFIKKSSWINEQRNEEYDARAAEEAEQKKQ